jgi:membrane-associated protease RseP (regulator of RpoE activity)
MNADQVTDQTPSQALPPAPDQAPLAPPPPTPQAARSIAGIVLLVLVFAIGVAVGSTGALGRSGASGGSTTTPPAGQPSAAPGASQPPNAPSDFGLFWEALNVIQQNFVGRADIDPQTLTYGAIRGMVQALGDTDHTVFLTPEQAQAEQNALDQNVVGIGVLLGEKDGQSVIVSVVPGSPAEAAGLKAGDVITAVNGQSTVGVPPDQLVDEVRGDVGSQVTVSIQRPSTPRSSSRPPPGRWSPARTSR